MEKQTLLKADNLSKRYGTQNVVNDLSFTINKGEVLGFLGPNGAGKSTTMKMLTGNLAPDSGQILINGIDLLDSPQSAKSHIGYLPETPPLYKELTTSEFLHFCARLNGIAKKEIRGAVDLALERCGLLTVKNRLIGNLSKGFQQRVGIAQAIIHSPAVVILDEPTSGLDPIQIREIRHLIREVAQEHSVILSTHILPEVQMLCDRVQIIAQGQQLFSDSIEKLSEQMQSTALIVEFASDSSVDTLAQIEQVSSCEQLSENRYRIHYQAEQNPTPQILRAVVEYNWDLKMLVPEQHSLEEVFMKIIQSEDANV